jgi:hypothetical protein
MLKLQNWKAVGIESVNNEILKHGSWGGGKLMEEILNRFANMHDT